MTAAAESTRRLPPGSHGIPAEVVARNQRERLVAAMAEVCAEQGYVEASVAAVAKRAAVSSVTFYRLFAGKLDCLLAAHRELLGRLLEEVDRASDGESGADRNGQTAIRAILALFAADAPSARLLTVEILAAGPEGSKRHDAMIEALGMRLRPDDRTRESPLSTADWVRIAGMLALVGKLVMNGEAARLPELVDELATTSSP